MDAGFDRVGKIDSHGKPMVCKFSGGVCSVHIIIIHVFFQTVHLWCCVITSAYLVIRRSHTVLGLPCVCSCYFSDHS